MKKFTKYTKDEIMKSLNEWEYGVDPMMDETTELFTIKAQKGNDIHDVDSALSKKAADEMVKDYQNEFGSEWKIFAVPTKSGVSENSTENEGSEIAGENIIYEILKNQSHRDEKKHYTLKQLEQLSKEDVEKIYQNLKNENPIKMEETEQTNSNENKTDFIDKIIAYESGELNDEDTLELFSHLIKTGQAWSLQGSYGRTAKHLIDMGYIDKVGNIYWAKLENSKDTELDENSIQDKGKFGDEEQQFDATPENEPTSDCGCEVIEIGSEIDENAGEQIWAEIRSDFTDEDGTTFIDAWTTEDDGEEGDVIAKVAPDGHVEYLNDLAKTNGYAQEVIRDVVNEKTGQVSEAKKVNPWAVCTSSVGREDKSKYEKCVMTVKAKQGMHESVEYNLMSSRNKGEKFVFKKGKMNSEGLINYINKTVEPTGISDIIFLKSIANELGFKFIQNENLTENKETEKSVVNEADIQTRNKMANETSKLKNLSLIKKVHAETAKLTKADLKNMISNELKAEKEAFQDRAETGTVGEKDAPKNQSFNETSAKLKTGEKVDDAIAMMRGDGMLDFLDSATIEPSEKYKEKNIKGNITPDLKGKKFDTQYGKIDGGGDHANVDTEMKVNHQVLKNMVKKSKIVADETIQFNRFSTKELNENVNNKQSEIYDDEDLTLIVKDIDETNSLVSEDIRKSYGVDKVVLTEETQAEVNKIKKLFGYNPTTYVKTKGNTPNIDLKKFKNL